MDGTGCLSPSNFADSVSAAIYSTVTSVFFFFQAEHAATAPIVVVTTVCVASDRDR